MSNEGNFNPCYSHCFIKYGRQHTSDCASKYKCDYAIMGLELQHMKTENEQMRIENKRLQTVLEICKGGDIANG